MHAQPAISLTAEQCRQADQYAIRELGIPGVVLMENAGRGAADLIAAWLETMPVNDPLVVIVCGKGNNGGDGLVIARHLAIRGRRAEIDMAAEPSALTDDAAVNWRIVERLGLPVRRILEPPAMAEADRRWAQADVLVDALLGTGFAGRVREPLATIIESFNTCGSAGDGSRPRPLRVAIDVPSGLNPDTGLAEGPAVRADHTITFLASKAGYAQPQARAWLGELHVRDIGAPLEMIGRAMGWILHA
jgi:NAD(P)H-hydrate epimerase